MKIWTLAGIALSAALTVSVAGGPAFAAPKQAKVCKALAVVDPDNDGQLDLSEAKAAAGKLFARLDPDKDGTLDKRELRGRLSPRELAAADPDKDKTLDKAEFTAIVEARFKAANTDKDTTIECKELGSAAGRALLRVLR